MMDRQQVDMPHVAKVIPHSQNNEASTLATTLFITLGDSNGLGAELACRFFAQGIPDYLSNRRILFFGAEKSLRAHTNAPFWVRIADPLCIEQYPAGLYLYEPEGLADIVVTPGKASRDGGLAAGKALESACDILEQLSPFSQKRGSFTHARAALVTLPLHKAMLQEAGFDVPGHTEYLARRAGLADDDVCMHLCGDTLRVSLVTTHPPLRLVPELVTRERVLHCLRLTYDFIQALGVQGDIAVCGLNPHAGESGKIGHEEIEHITPAIIDAVVEGIPATGPFAADTLFGRAAAGEAAAVLAMYHDQGLGPLKLMHFSDAVNVTLGLPFIRTSVDHGTGFDIVGTGKASTGSFNAALRLACALANRSL